MAALPFNNTGILFLDYSAAQENHTVLCRFGESSSPGEAMTVLHNLLTALNASLTLLTVLGARVRDKNGAVSYDIAWTGDDTYGGTLGSHEKAAFYGDFVGRSIGGVRSRMAIFGFGEAFDTSAHDYRFTVGESEIVADAIATLEANPFCPVAADGDVVNWKQYLNVGVNAYWRNRIR